MPIETEKSCDGIPIAFKYEPNPHLAGEDRSPLVQGSFTTTEESYDENFSITCSDDVLPEGATVRDMEALKESAKRVDVLSQLHSVRIVDVLVSGPKNVHGLAERLDKAPNELVECLTSMQDAGLIVVDDGGIPGQYSLNLAMFSKNAKGRAVLHQYLSDIEFEVDANGRCNWCIERQVN